MEENWKPIEGYVGYEISDLGKVRNKHGKYFRLKPHPYKGYIEVSLINEHGRKSIAVHRLVALHFVENPNPHIYKCVNHKTGNKIDNRAEVLEWCSHSQNVQHAYDVGIMKPTHGAAKLTIEDAIDIKKLLSMGMSTDSISKLFSISSNQVRSVKKRTWGTLKSVYKLSRLSF